MTEIKGPKRYFSKVTYNPYFSSDYYQKETSGGKIENKLNKILDKILRRKA
jgi:hypothetical protein